MVRISVNSSLVNCNMRVRCVVRVHAGAAGYVESVYISFVILHGHGWALSVREVWLVIDL